MLASTALRELIGGPRRRGTPLGRSRVATWVAFGEHMVTVGTPSAVRLPTAIQVDRADTSSVVIGDGLVNLDGRELPVARWWDPRPVLPPSTTTDIRDTVTAWPLRGEADDAGLSDALTRRDHADVVAAATSLIGRGPGLTPEGDDLLSAAMASFLLVGEAVSHPSTAALVGSVAPPLRTLARRRTTTLSASLIAHALRGRVALPVAALLHAVAGGHPVEQALERVNGIGHSSGPALVAGIVAGATAACGGSR